MKSLIAITGLDGSGKTTQIELLKPKLNNPKIIWMRYNPLFLWPLMKLFNKKKKSTEKDYFKFVNKKQSLFENKILKETYFLMSFLDYYSQILIKVNIPYLFNQKIILDRYFYDYLVDLSINFNLNERDLKKFSQRKIFNLLIKPDISILLDLDPEESLKRKDDPNVPHKNYLIERREKYLEIAKIFNMKVINANNNIEIVQNKILQVLK